MAAKKAHDLLGLAEAQQPMIYKDARKPLADGLMNEDRVNGRIRAPREAAKDARTPRLRADRGNCLGPERAHRPIGTHTRDIAQEIRKQLGAVRRVGNLKVKLDAEQLAGFIGDRREWRVARSGNAKEARRQFSHGIAVAHPNRIAFALPPDPVKQGVSPEHLDLGAAEFALVPRGDFPPSCAAMTCWP